MPLNKELLDEALRGLRNPRPYFTAQPFQNYAPLQMTEPAVPDPSTTQLRMDAIEGGSRLGTEAFTTQQENRRMHELATAREAMNEQLRGRLATVRENEPEPVARRESQFVEPGSNRNQPSQPSGPENERGRWGSTPEVSDIGRLRPNAPITTVNWRGHEFQVNRQVAPIFTAFLEELYGKGYRPTSIGGYSNRNIAGTNTRSLHSYGFAIDIDPTRNPVQDADGHMQTDLPPGIKSLANKYGLAWGGSWNSYKDPMHFSVPWGGRE